MKMVRGFFRAIFEKVKQGYDQPWYLPGLSLMTFLNVFFVLLPVEPVMIPGVVLRPKRWLRVSFWMSVSGTLGSLVLAYLIAWKGQAAVDWLAPHAQTSSGWLRTQRFTRDYGSWALALISALPLPVLPALSFAVLSRVSMFKILLACFAGRIVKFGGLAYCAAYFPNRLARSHRIDGA